MSTVSERIRAAREQRTTTVEFAPGCHHIERGGLVIGRYITNYRGQIKWHVVYEAAGLNATLDTLLDEVAASHNNSRHSVKVV